MGNYCHIFRFELVMLMWVVLGIKPHAVGKRTPRVPVSYSYDKDGREKLFSPSKHNSKGKVDDPNDDDVAHEIALVLTEASQRDGSPQLSQTPNPKIEGHVLSPIRNDRMVIIHRF